MYQTNRYGMMDSQAVLGFLTHQLAYIETQVAEIQYPDIQYPTIIPVDTSADEWARSIMFTSQDKVGRAGWFNANAKDTHNADVLRSQHEVGVEMADIGYRFNLEEIQNAMKLGQNLNSDKAAAAYRAYEEFVDRVAIEGDTSRNLEGIIDYTGVTATDATNDGTSSSRFWTAKTGDQILRDVNDILSGVYSTSNTVEMADTILLPVAAMTLIATKRISDTNMTVLQFLQANNIYSLMTGRPLTIRALRQLATAATDGSGRMIAYRRDPQVIKMHLPMAHRFLPAWQLSALAWEVPGIFRLAGVEIRRPGAVRYLDKIMAAPA